MKDSHVKGTLQNGELSLSISDVGWPVIVTMLKIKRNDTTNTFLKQEGLNRPVIYAPAAAV